MLASNLTPLDLDEPKKRFLMTICLGAYQNFEDFFDYGHIRYHTLLAYNPHYPDCEENRRLRKLYDAFEAGDDALINAGSTSCSLLFTDYIRKDYKVHVKIGQDKIYFSNVYTAAKSPVIKIQAKTININNDMQFLAHTSKLTYPTTSPIKSKFRGIPRVLRKNIEICEEIRREIFRVRISGNDYCLKTIYHYFDEDAFCRELESLQRAPVHPNISRLVAVVVVGVEAESRIDGIVLSLVNNAKPLNEIGILGKAPAGQWKLQIADAMLKFHEKDVVWGHAAVENVLIDEDQNAIVVDFSGGRERNSKAADMEGLSRIFEFIDDCVERGNFRDQMDEANADPDELLSYDTGSETTLVEHSAVSPQSLSRAWR